MVTFIEKIDALRMFIVTSLSNNFHVTPEQASILFRVVIGYVIVFFVVFKIHRSIHKKYLHMLELITYTYDGIWYTLSLFVYHNPHFQQQFADHWGLYQLLYEEKKDYLSHKKRILQGIEKMESDMQVTIVEKKQWTHLKRLQTQMGIKHIFDQLFGRFLTGITLGIYKLFW